MNSAYINLNVSGSISLADFVKIAHLVQPDEGAASVGSQKTVTVAYVAESVEEAETAEQAEPVEKKRRGRPAKVKEAGPAEQAEPEAVEEAATEEDDEFAAFANAAAEVQTADAEAKAAIPARKWTDADLGSLCNQAAVKLGDPAPVKALITEFVDADEVPHSRNIPEDRRADFAAAVEEKAGITFT